MKKGITHKEACEIVMISYRAFKVLETAYVNVQKAMNEVCKTANQIFEAKNAALKVFEATLKESCEALTKD